MTMMNSRSPTTNCQRKRRRNDPTRAWISLSILCSFVAISDPSLQLSLQSFIVVVESWSPTTLAKQPTRSASSYELKAAKVTTMPLLAPASMLLLDDSIKNSSNEEHHHSRSSTSSSLLVHRRTALFNIAAAAGTILFSAASPLPSHAYTPDPDKLQESLYFINRVQEATVQQERFVNKLGGTKELQTKLKLTLRLVDKNYKLLDQINFSSAYITPPEKLVEASEAGYEAVDALQSAIDFVRNEDNWLQPETPEACQERTVFLTKAMQDCREQLLMFTEYMPANKLRNARYRVEDENVKNRDEFDGDEDAGVYNPVNLPWKPVMAASASANVAAKK